MPYKDKKKQTEYDREYRGRDYVREKRRIRRQKYLSTKEGWASNLYSHMQNRCGKGKYKNTKVTLTRSEFIKLVRDTAGFDQMIKPSVDRIDSKGDYSLENTRIIELAENSGRANRKYLGCLVVGCENKHWGHGFCLKHYSRYIRRGTLDDLKRFGDRMENHINEAEALGLHSRVYKISR